MTDHPVTAFYAARLDEEELDAQKADATVLPPGFPRLTHLVYGLERAGFGLDYQGFAAVHDPASVLASVAADRRILARYKDLSQVGQLMDRIPFSLMAGQVLACIRDRAARFSTHPEYDPSWAPAPAERMNP